MGGGGVKKSWILAYVLYGWSLSSFSFRLLEAVRSTLKQSLTRKVSKENGRQTICCSKHFWSIVVVFCVYVLHDMMIYESSVTIYLAFRLGGVAKCQEC